MASILSIAATAANSADIALAADTVATFGLRGTNGIIPSDALVYLQRKGSNNEYSTFARLDSNTPVLNIRMNATIRARREAGGSVGVDQD